jgi:hypothetical protein
MKTWIIAALITSQAFALTPIPPTYAGQMKDARLGVSPTKSAELHWNPEKGDSPLSVRAAVQAARAALKKLLPAGEAHFDCYDIAIHGQGDSWYYVIRFQSLHASLIKEVEGGGIYPAILPFIVYTDGSVELPFEIKANKAPEPTSGAVTPRAIETKSK